MYFTLILSKLIDNIYSAWEFGFKMEFIHKFVIISIGILLSIAVLISITVSYKRSVSAESQRKKVSFFNDVRFKYKTFH